MRGVEVSVVGRAGFTAFGELGRFIAARNGEPSGHIGYFGDEPDDVTDELREIEGDWAFALARSGDRLVGALGAEWDPEVGRIWLLGPWAPDGDLMDRLYAALAPWLPAGIPDREIFCNAANALVLAFADRHGFGDRREQYVLRFERDRLTGPPPPTFPLLDAGLAEQFAALHDRAFPGTHASAASLLAKGEPIRVAIEDGRLLGYVILKLRPEFNDAQVDYIAVDEAARGRGIGARLLTAALHEAFADERFTRMDLVTNNPVARRLYEKVGFTLHHDMRSCNTARPV